MTQPTNERPSDEVTAKVVAKWKGWGRGCVPIKPGISRSKIVAFMEGDGDLNGETLGSVADPRTDTDAALELLAYLCDEHGTLTRQGHGWYWYAWGDDINSTFPSSGPKFRYAVVRLAVQCLGVEG